MNKFFLSILTLLIPFHFLGQMFPSSNHFILNTIVINPAFSGCNEALSATVSYRNQWVGFDDAPKSYTFSVHAPVNNDKIGLGILVDKNSVGIFSQTNIIGNYAYRMKLFNGKLALGIGFDATLYSASWDELKATDPGDQQILNNTESAVMPNFSMGAFYFTKKYFFSFSIPLFLSHEFDQSNGRYKIKNDFSNYNYFFTGGYRFTIRSHFKFVPSVLIKYHPKNIIQYDFNTQFNYNDKFWMGIGYRSKNTIIGITQLQLNYQLRLAYSYDYTLGSIGKYSNGSHEIVLNYIFRYSRKVMGPKQF